VFGGLIIIVIFVLIALVFALSIQYWFVAIPLFLLVLFGLMKREQRRERRLTPQERERRDQEVARLIAQLDMSARQKQRQDDRRRKRQRNQGQS